MSSRRSARLKQERETLAGAAMDAYLRWRDECDAVWGAYHRWVAAGATDARLAFQVYAAALDREEQASKVYAMLFQRADEVLLSSAAGAPRPSTYPRRAGFVP